MIKKVLWVELVGLTIINFMRKKPMNNIQHVSQNLTSKFKLLECEPIYCLREELMWEGTFLHGSYLGQWDLNANFPFNSENVSRKLSPLRMECLTINFDGLKPVKNRVLKPRQPVFSTLTTVQIFRVEATEGPDQQRPNY